MIKILNVMTTGFTVNDGISAVALNYYKYLPKNEFSVDFASYNQITKELREYLNKNESQYYCLPHRKKKTILYIFKLLSLIRKQQYDIIHIHGNSSTMFFELVSSILGKVKCRIVHAHTTKTEYPRLHNLLYPFFIRSYTVAVAVSKKAGDWLYKNRSYLILNNAIDLSKYRFNSCTRFSIRDYFNLDDQLVIGNVGRLTDSKNQSFLINIFHLYHSKNPNSKLLLVGDGEDRSALEQLIKQKQLDDDVIFTGSVNNAYDYYQAMDCFIFPSKYEGLGLVLVEAQASGLNCIASNTIPLETKLTDSIFYEDLNSPLETWTSKICMSNTHEREKQSDENIRLIKKKGYSIQTEVQKLINIYLSNT